MPREFDWRQKKGVSPVKGAADSGGSWAYAAVSSIESKLAIDYAQGKFSKIKDRVNDDGFMIFSEQ